jgi:hypothetical protein
MIQVQNANACGNWGFIYCCTFDVELIEEEINEGLHSILIDEIVSQVQTVKHLVILPDSFPLLLLEHLAYQLESLIFDAGEVKTKALDPREAIYDFEYGYNLALG